MSQTLLQFIQSVIVDHESDDTLYFYPEVDYNGQVKLVPSDDLLKLFTQVYKEGLQEGYNEGFDSGYKRGFSIGYTGDNNE